MRLGSSLTSLTALACAMTGLSGTALGQEKSNIPLPTAEQRGYLAGLAPGGARLGPPATPMNVSIKGLGNYSLYSTYTSDGQSVDVALQSANELVILLKPDLTGPQITAALEHHRLRVVQTMPAIGAIVVDASQRLGMSGSPAAVAAIDAATETPVNLLARSLREDQRFIAVAPNAAISTFSLKSAFLAMPVQPGPAAANERADWGMADTKMDAAWPKMTTPIRIGVIDVGFAAHEDLDTATGLPGPLAVHDHGNHVAGILCAKHNNIGVKGALKNCTIVESSGRFILNGAFAPEGFGADRFVTLFSEYVGTTSEFITKNPGVRVINLSLGYNWMNNFNIDPRSPGFTGYRNDMRAQGRIFAAILAQAKSQNIALVMAAGNDSTTLNPPLEAEWASPFNQGSMLMEQQDGWTNGLIVEAYGKDHKRAAFSNVNGHVSCPGVSVLSSLASGASAYGEMSGTSMAAPYCAAGLAAGIMLRPELSLREIVECVRSSPDKIDNRVPRLNVDHLVNGCKKN